MKPGDGVVFENLSDTNDEQGGSVYEMRGTRLGFRHGHLRMADIGAGTRVFKTSDPALNRALRQTFEREIPLRKRQRLYLRVTGRAEEPLRVTASLEGGGEKRGVCSAMPLQAAVKRPLTKESFCEQFGRLGGTVFDLGDVCFEIEGGVILPVSELNRRRGNLAGTQRPLAARRHARHADRRLKSPPALPSPPSSSRMANQRPSPGTPPKHPAPSPSSREQSSNALRVPFWWNKATKRRQQRTKPAQLPWR
jgi:putative protease